MTTIQELKNFALSKNGKCLSSVYINSHTKYLWEDDDGNQWNARWYSIKQGKWSPYKVKQKQRDANLRYTINDLHNFATGKQGKCLSTKYVTYKTKYKWADSKNREFLMTWDNVMQGQWSPHEKKETLSALKQETTIETLRLYALKNGGKCLSEEYKGYNHSYLWEDSNNKQFYRTWAAVRKSKKLKFYNTISTGQAQLISFIKNELNISHILINTRNIIENNELDIYLPDYKIAFEFHGVRWHTEDHVGKTYHLDKFNKCKNKGIQLIQIFDFEWKDRKCQLKSFIKSKLMNNNVKVSARKCEIRKDLDKDTINQFLETQHIQGSVAFESSYSLIFKGELIALITIAKHHRNANEYVLNRFIVKTNHTVAGGLSRLVKTALNDYNKLKTWVDLRYSNGNSWLNLGWKLENQITPDYFYIDDNNKVYSKQSQRKKNKDSTEREETAKKGLKRVYDCGKLTLIITK